MDQAQEFKLLITDIVLPKISGKDVAKKFLGKNPNLKVIFTTGYHEEIENTSLYSTNSILMQKPFSLNTLLCKVREQLDSIAHTQDQAAS